jgi:signal recognition particle subunit SRP54
MMETLATKLRSALNKLKIRPYVDEKTIKEIIKEIQKGLILSDVNIKIVLELSKRIEERALRERPLEGISMKENVIRIIYEEITRILGEYTPELKIRKGKTNKVMLIGIQGSGKTTTAAKLGKYFKEQGYKVGLFSTDTYRPAGREQLKQLSEIVGVGFFDYPSDNALEIAEKGIQYFNNKVDIVIIDTAGRHKKEETLLKEMEELSKVIKPDYTFLVIDASIGQQAYSQAKAFHERVPVGGIIITKLDGTAKGGGAISASVATGAKIYFIGTGEKIDDLEYYSPPSFVGRLLGLGDIEGLLKKIERIKITEERKKKLMKIAKGKFTLLDMIEQFDDISKMGGLYKVLSMIPGLGGAVPKESIEQVEKKIKKWKYAIDSMTDEEKIDPSIIKKSRLERISKGSGVEEGEIKEMIKQYNMLKKLMKSGKKKRLLKMLGRDLDLSRYI